MSTTTRTMLPTDIDAVLAIQLACYTEIEPESRTSMQAKMRASPSTCFVACVDGRVVGYLLSIPWSLTSPPMLNANDCMLPERPDCLYLHDLAIAPAARGTGAGRALVQRFFERLKALDFERACLIAIQSSADYWRRQGFRTVPMTTALKAKLASYGERACYLEYRAPGIPSASI